MSSKSSMCLVISCLLQIVKAEPVRVSQRQALISLRCIYLSISKEKADEWKRETHSGSRVKRVLELSG